MFVTLKQPRQVRSYADGVPGSYARVFNDDVLRFMGLSDDAIFNGLLYSVVGILVALIMVGSIFLIYNSFTISLNDPKATAEFRAVRRPLYRRVGNPHRDSCGNSRHQAGALAGVG